jgi:regulation of enolase protein 1 (concanavalin A-like superfamily)
MRSCSRFRVTTGFVCVACILMAAAPPAIKGWGQAADPLGDCRFDAKNGKLIITIPGKLHNLVAEENQVNAPTVLSPVKGEFIAMVRATGSVRPGPKCSVPDGLPYNGAGLLLWVDRNNYFRLERAGLLREGSYITYVNFEQFQGGRRVYSQGGELQDLATDLRLERRGGKIYASASQDGVQWLPFPPLDARLPDEVKIGVAAINSSTKPFAAELEGLNVFTRREPPSR